MKENVIGCYENIDEDGRLFFNNVRKVEYLTNLHYISQYVLPGFRILDCCCGTGAYSIPLSDSNVNIWAYDLTPKHIDLLNGKIASRHISNIKTGICDAQEMSEFEDNSFDIVLCMGALYHLLSLDEQMKCIRECKRVVKNNGILVFSYLNRSSILPYILKKDKKHFNQKTIQKFLDDKKTRWNADDFCFFTDSYYHIPEEIEDIMASMKISRMHHVGSDGLSYDYEEFVNQLTEDEFNTWLFYHFNICEQTSLLGVSQHGLYVGRSF